MEKEGFIYIWYDRKRKMYYIGCHYGTVDDGYICSSNRMRDAYRRRPHDFKRRILQKNISKENLLKEEYRWLQMIDSEEIGKKYYNLYQRHFGHWTLIPNEEQKKSISRKQSEWQKGKQLTEEHKRKISEAHKGKKYPNRKKSVLTTEHKKNISKGRKGIKFSDEHRANLSKAVLKQSQDISRRRKGMKFSDEHRANLSKAIKSYHEKRKLH